MVKTPSPVTKTSPIFQQIQMDYRLSFILLKENLVPLITVGIIGSGLFYLLNFLVESFIFPLILWQNYSVVDQIIIYNLLKFPQQGILFGFFGAIMGMVHDILASGDGFTQIQNFVGYIGKYWGKFFLLSIIVNIFTYIVRYTGQEILNLGLAILANVITLIWFIILVESSPALVNSNNVIQALKENFRILRKHSTRIFISFLVFYVIFILPKVILFFLEYYVVPSNTIGYKTVSNLEIIAQLFYILIGYPINGFLAMRIYFDYKYDY
ncbi:MAG: hypothetical protein K9W44_13460 [Candidatus Lokiarchaeota archaeon]|nr:hypothetical protein [Candidatus Harpocratesius repetitus]